MTVLSLFADGCIDVPLFEGCRICRFRPEIFKVASKSGLEAISQQTKKREKMARRFKCSKWLLNAV
jgi:hypothetical protein